jgi:hypothetical protein
MARKKALVSTFLHLELHMKDTLKVECSGDMVHLIGQMEINMKDSMSEARNREKEPSTGLMAKCLKEPG